MKRVLSSLKFWTIAPQEVKGREADESVENTAENSQTQRRPSDEAVQQNSKCAAVSTLVCYH